MIEAALQARAEDSNPLEDVEILTEIVLALVSNPESVFVDKRDEDDVSHFVIHVAAEDIGKVIGKSGETVSILRRLFGRIAASRGRRVVIDVHDPNKRRFTMTKTATYRRSAA